MVYFLISIYFLCTSTVFSNLNSIDDLPEGSECVKTNYNLRLPLANSHGRQETIQNEARLLKIANLLELDIKEVAGLSEKNARVNYGVTFVAGHPFSKAAYNQFKKWRQEVSDITKSKVLINADYAHATVGAMFRSQDQVFSAEQFDSINFELVLQAIQEAGPYTIKFTSIEWGFKRDGNIVLAGEIIKGAENISVLQRKFQEAGFDLKWKQLEPGKMVKAYVTLAHINIEALKTLSEEEARNLNNWVKAHGQLKEGPVFMVRNINLANYSNRILTEMVSPDMVFTLGSMAQFEDGKALKESLSQIWKSHVQVVKKDAEREILRQITDLIKAYLSPEMQEYFNIPNLPLSSHNEGPLLINHLQAMLDTLNNLKDNAKIPEKYKAILSASENRIFFENFIVLHDIGKFEVFNAHKDKELKSYSAHEEESVKILQRNSKLGDQLIDRNILIEVIRLHGIIYEISKSEVKPGIVADFIKRYKVKEEKKIMPFLIACAFLDVIGTNRGQVGNIKAIDGMLKFAERYELYKSGIQKTVILTPQIDSSI